MYERKFQTGSFKKGKEYLGYTKPINQIMKQNQMRSARSLKWECTLLFAECRVRECPQSLSTIRENLCPRVSKKQ